MRLLGMHSTFNYFPMVSQSVLVVAGAFKRAEPDLAEDALLMRALRDFNIPKIVREDEVVFFGLLGGMAYSTTSTLHYTSASESRDFFRGFLKYAL